MKLACHLRTIRGDRTLASIVALSGVNEPELSKIERGIMLPRDAWVPALEAAYGAPRHEWWPPEVLVALSTDEAVVA